MASQLNFTEIVFDVNAAGTFAADPTRLPGSTRATLFASPRQIVRRRGPDGLKQIERPIQFAYEMTWEGEFYPGVAWTKILANFFQRSAVSGTGMVYTPSDLAPVEFYMEAQVDGGGELYSLQNCVLASLSVQWQVNSLPVFRMEWKVRSIGAPEGLTPATIAEATPAHTIGRPSLTNVYFRRGASAWGSDPPTAYAADAQSVNMLFTRDIRHAQFDVDGNATRWEWSADVDASGRIQAVLSQGDISFLYNGTDRGLIRVDMPTVLDGAQGFYFDLYAQMAIQNLPIMADAWASRVVEFVSVQDAAGTSIIFYDGQ